MQMRGEALSITDGNLIEFSCDDCRRSLGGRVIVLHRFDVAGVFVETEVADRTILRDVTRPPRRS